MKKPIEFSNDPQGWVKLERNLLESPIVKNPTLLQIYVWSRLKANHQPKWFSIKVGNGTKEVYCDVGQFITGRKRAAEELGMPESTFYNNIKKLEDYGYLIIESNNKFSLITVVNIDNVKISQQPTEQQTIRKSSSNVTAKEQQTNTNNNNEKDKKENNKIDSDIISNSNINKELKSIKNENSKIQNWIIEAYEELLNKISRDYPRVNLILHKLSIEEFEELFSSYDWEDILSKCEAIENWEHTHRQKSVYKILKTFLNNDNNISVLDGVEKNSYLSYRLHFEESVMRWEEEKRQKRLADGYYDEIGEDYKALYMELKDSTVWDQFDLTSHKKSKKKVVRSYLRFKFLLSQQKQVAKVYNLNDFKIEEYLELVDAGFTYEALRYYVDQFAVWPKRKNHKSIYEGYGEFMLEIMEDGRYEH